MAVLLLAGSVCGEEGSAAMSATPDVSPGLAGYHPVSDVTSHSMIDLDIKDITAAGSDYAAAAKIYTEGKNSVKSDGTKRTLQGFSASYADEGSSKQGEHMAILVNDYWGRFDYADKVVTAALNGEDDVPPSGFPSLGNFATGKLAQKDAVRKQLIKKGVAFASTWMYALHEMEAALIKYSKGDLDQYKGAPYALDEAWVFYAGSAEKGNSSGYGPYTAAEKFAQKFGTWGYEMGTGGRSRVNAELLYQFTAMQRFIQLEGNQEALNDIAKCIRAQFKVPLIQGCLSYTFTASSKDLTADADVPKYKAEAWAFCITALPFLHEVDPASAKAVEATVSINVESRPDWSVVKKAFSTQNLNKMGIQCQEVGILGGNGYDLGVAGDAAPYALSEMTSTCRDDISLVRENMYSDSSKCFGTKMPRCGSSGMVCNSSSSLQGYGIVALCYSLVIAFVFSW